MHNMYSTTRVRFKYKIVSLLTDYNKYEFCSNTFDIDLIKNFATIKIKMRKWPTRSDINHVESKQNVCVVVSVSFVGQSAQCVHCPAGEGIEHWAALWQCWTVLLRTTQPTPCPLWAQLSHVQNPAPHQVTLLLLREIKTSTLVSE